MGEAQGEHWRELVRAFCAQRIEAFAQYTKERGLKTDVAAFLRVGKACHEEAMAWDAEGTTEARGIAAGAGVDADELYAVTNMTDVRDVLLLPPDGMRDEGCSALLIPRTHSSVGVIAAQTWDLNPNDLDYIVAVHRLPDEGPETWSITCAGCLSLVGMNDQGVCVGTTNIKTRSSRVGVGYLSILHNALCSPSYEAAREGVATAPRAAAHTYWVADAAHGVEFEVDPTLVAERDLAVAPLCRTNHCIATALAERQGEPTNSSSQKRLSRMTTMLGRTDHDVGSVKAIFADRADGMDSINRYPEDAQGTTTNACIICLPGQRTVHACRGPADRGKWVELRFAGRQPLN